ncbi:MAG: undecaprenyl-diphosphate phosphatase [Hyphomicrobiales bacterium]|nr:undecaprenyl-diphosphate phosphatase [Hyphomicrobiales bacterium]
MQNFTEAAILAIIQGITEFLPISSSAHIALIESMPGWSDQGVAFEIAVHLGTLLAVLVYFRRDVIELIFATLNLLRGKTSTHTRIAVGIVIATLPVIPAGAILLEADWRILFHAIEPIAWVNLVFALLLYFADKLAPLKRNLFDLSYIHALLVGCAQTLALIPGVSRAGITITMARALGYARPQAARFSMLLAIPTILASTGALMTSQTAPDYSDITLLLFSGALAFIVAVAVIALFLRMIAHTSMAAFVIYRIALSAVLLGWIYF